MSSETMEWLNTMVLVGMTEKRGHAWHWRLGSDNHYPGFIPVEEVQRRLFSWEPVDAQCAYLKPIDDVSAATEARLGYDHIRMGGQYFKVVIDPERKAIVDPDKDVVFDYPSKEYQIHDYSQWLLRNVSTILDDDLGITSAGLLKNRAQAWVEVSVPDTIETPEGFPFRPNLLAFTSLNRTFRSTYKRTTTATICDNTLAAAIGEQSETVGFRHTARSLQRIGEVRAALNLVYKTADEFSKSVAELCRVDVTNRQWQQVLEALVPFPEVKGRAYTIRENKREKLDYLYHWDPRCSPWKGTKFGVVQTFNTFQQHESTVQNRHGGGRAERNQLQALGGQVENFDRHIAETVDKVLAAAS